MIAVLLRRLAKLPLFIIAVPIVLVMRALRPLCLIRVGALVSHRLGHFAGNTELYLSERAAGIGQPRKPHLDLFFMIKPVSNRQLASMWARILRIWPGWLLSPVRRVNAMIPGGEPHDIGQNTQWDRDVHNLMEDSEPWLRFDSQEEARGAAGLFQLGIPVGAPFVCLIVRDSAYLDSHMPNVEWSYHSFRDSSIQNYVLAAEELANRGYYVLRMGASVREAIPSNHPRVIDYAFNRMRSDFMDVYLGAKCRFCVSMGTGFDALPYIFRRPIVFVNSVPLGYLFTFSSRFIAITRHHVAVNGDRELTLGEITARDLGFCLNAAGFEKQGVKPLENSPDEIRDVVIEMDERLNGTWQAQEGDDDLQKRFWEMFPSNAARNGNPLHGEIRSRYGATFLRKNRWWLDLPADIGRGATASAAH